MKKYSLLMLMNLILLFGCSNASEKLDPYVVIKPDTDENPSFAIPLKGICIFAGQADTFADDDWHALANSVVTDFIIIPKDAGQYGANETGYKTQLGSFMVNVINQLVTRNGRAKIWIGTPGLSSLNYTTASSSLDPIYNYLNFVRDQVATSIWNKNIGGIYMNMESIYGTMDYTNILANPCIKLMSDLSSRIHNNLKTKFLWIPYYGYGSNPNEIIKRLAFVTNTSTIFDYVVIQPHYYFDDSIVANLSGVKNSISKQTICYRDGLEVIPKLSKTIIGAEMELNWKIVPPNNYTDFLNRYNEYVSSFAEYKFAYPIIFYWDGTLQSVITGRINPFFNNK